jgi:hypothetical protein
MSMNSSLHLPIYELHCTDKSHEVYSLPGSLGKSGENRRYYVTVYNMTKQWRELKVPDSYQGKLSLEISTLSRNSRNAEISYEQHNTFIILSYFLSLTLSLSFSSICEADDRLPIYLTPSGSN